MKQTQFPSTKEESDALIENLDPQSLLVYKVIRREALKSDPDDSHVQLKHVYERLPKFTQGQIIGRYGALCRKGLVYTKVEEMNDDTTEKFIYLPEYENGWWPPPIKSTKDAPQTSIEEELQDSEQQVDTKTEGETENPSTQQSLFPEIEVPLRPGKIEEEVNRFEILMGFIDRDYLIFSFEDGECVKVGGFDTMEKVRGYLNQCPELEHKVLQSLNVRKKVSYEFQAPHAK